MKPTANERTLRIAAHLGVDTACGTHTHAARTAHLAHHAARLHASLGPGSVALITGPSGAGKSTLLRLLPRNARTVTARPLTRRQRQTCVVALNTRQPVAHWARLLARFGLAEASVLLSRAGDLSTGEQARLELALAAARCEMIAGDSTRTSPGQKPGRGNSHASARAADTENKRASQIRPCAPAQGPSPPVTLVIDEWCSMLDRDTAASVAVGAARWARERAVRLIGATAHADLASSINADITVQVTDMGGVEWTVYGLNAAG